MSENQISKQSKHWIAIKLQGRIGEVKDLLNAKTGILLRQGSVMLQTTLTIDSNPDLVFASQKIPNNAYTNFNEDFQFDSIMGFKNVSFTLSIEKIETTSNNSNASRSMSSINLLSAVNTGPTIIGKVVIPREYIKNSRDITYQLRDGSLEQKISGKVSLKIEYFPPNIQRKTHGFSVTISRAVGLYSSTASRSPNSFALLHIFPDLDVTSTEQTCVKKETADPVFSEVFFFSTTKDPSTFELHVSLWDQKNVNEVSFLGQTLIPLGPVISKLSKTRWYYLTSLHDDSIYSAYKKANSVGEDSLEWSKGFIKYLQQNPSIPIEEKKHDFVEKVVMASCIVCSQKMIGSHLSCNGCAASCHRKCEELLSSSCGGLGCLKVSLNLSKTIVLDLEHYSDLINAIMANNFEVALALTKSKEDREQLANELLAVLGNRYHDFLVIAIQDEIGGMGADGSKTLFRGNTFVSRSLASIMKIQGNSYLASTLEDPLTSIVNSRKPFEIDEKKMEDISYKDQFGPEGTLTSKNLSNMLNFLNLLTDSILQSASAMPVQLCELFRAIQVEAIKRFPLEKNVPYTSVTSFLFLRFISPAILSPSSNGMDIDTSDPFTSRKLLLLGKTILNLANLQIFKEKEECMEPLNAFIMERIPQLKKFVDQITSIGAANVADKTLDDQISPEKASLAAARILEMLISEMKTASSIFNSNDSLGNVIAALEERLNHVENVVNGGYNCFDDTGEIIVDENRHNSLKNRSHESIQVSNPIESKRRTLHFNTSAPDLLFADVVQPGDLSNERKQSISRDEKLLQKQRENNWIVLKGEIEIGLKRLDEALERAGEKKELAQIRERNSIAEFNPVIISNEDGSRLQALEQGLEDIKTKIKEGEEARLANFEGNLLAKVEKKIDDADKEGQERIKDAEHRLNLKFQIQSAVLGQMGKSTSNLNSMGKSSSNLNSTGPEKELENLKKTVQDNAARTNLKFQDLEQLQVKNSKDIESFISETKKLINQNQDFAESAAQSYDEKLNDQLNGMQSKINQIEADLQRLSENSLAVPQENSQMQNFADTVEQKLSAISKELLKVRDDSSLAKSQAVESLSKHKETISQITSHVESLNTLKRQVEEGRKPKQLAELKKQLEDLKQQLLHSNEAKESKVERMHTDMEQQKSFIKSLTVEIDSIKTKEAIGMKANIEGNSRVEIEVQMRKIQDLERAVKDLTGMPANLEVIIQNQLRGQEKDSQKLLEELKVLKSCTENAELQELALRRELDAQKISILAISEEMKLPPKPTEAEKQLQNELDFQKTSIRVLIEELSSLKSATKQIEGGKKRESLSAASEIQMKKDLSLQKRNIQTLTEELDVLRSAAVTSGKAAEAAAKKRSSDLQVKKELESQKRNIQALADDLNVLKSRPSSPILQPSIDESNKLLHQDLEIQNRNIEALLLEFNALKSSRPAVIIREPAPPPPQVSSGANTNEEYPPHLLSMPPITFMDHPIIPPPVVNNMESNRFSSRNSRYQLENSMDLNDFNRKLSNLKVQRNADHRRPSTDLFPYSLSKRINKVTS